MATTRSWLFVVSAGLLTPAAAAQGLGLLADDRSVSISVTPGCCNEVLEPEFFGSFPRQSSSFEVSADGLGLSGTARPQAAGLIDAQQNFRTSVSLFSFVFRIDGEGTIGFDGCFESSPYAAPGEGSVRFLAGDEVLFERERNPFMPCMDEGFEFSAELAPGAYTLEARAAGAGVDSGISIELAFAIRDTAVPVPEPATLWMIAGGLGWLGRRSADARLSARRARGSGGRCPAG